MAPILILSILAASTNSLLLHKVPPKSNVLFFNLCCSVVWFCILFPFNGFSIQFSMEALFWGVLYGIAQVLFLVFKTKAMNSGPISITTMFGNCSLLLSTVVSVIVWDERISIPQSVGLVLLIAAVIACSVKKTDRSASAKWLIYCIFFFVFASGVGIVFKCYSKNTDGTNINNMMLIASLTMLVLLSVCSAISFKMDSAHNKPAFGKKFYLIALFSGMLSCAYNRINIMLAGALDGAVFYPCFNGGVILISLLFGIVFLKERISKRQLISLLVGIAAIVVIGIT